MSKRFVLFSLTLLLTGCSGGTNLGSADESRSGLGTTAASWRDPVPAPPPPQNMPPANSPMFFSAAAAEFAYSQQRGIDQQSNPDYIARTAPLIPDFISKSNGGTQSIEHALLHDPYLAPWGQTRGQIVDVEITNRYGAILTGRLYGPKLPFTDPVSGSTSGGPFPAVIFVPGHADPAANSANDHFATYEGSLEQLAESGYIVLGVNPQGQGGSEYFRPPSPYCDPDGAWKQPQELGITERGGCAGQEKLAPYSGDLAAVYDAVSSLPFPLSDVAWIAQRHLDPQSAQVRGAANYDGWRARFVFPAWDAATWLLSDQNPWRALVDAERLGMLGHSAGSDAAVVAANGDPRGRFKAAIAWDDTSGLPPDTLVPTVPTLLMRTESMGYFGPYVEPPHDEIYASYRIAQRFIADHVAVMLNTLRGSNHYECGYIPYALLDPLTEGPVFNMSAKGGQVNEYYTIAWLDRWLKGAATSHPRGDEAAQIASARARLLARTFDDSADRASLGQGTYSLLARSNVPYKIAGERVADHLTFFLRSEVAFDGVTCLDWQTGCSGP